MELKFKPEYLADLDKLAKTHSMSRENLLDLIKKVLEQVAYADEETIVEILDSGVISTGELDIEETEDPATYCTGFSVTFRLEEITREDCENWNEYFSDLLSRKSGEE
ncbi:hypothetical protein [Turicimonas muris]|uniref:hypothetical protein n=1 Tax=Turicimonas muris TaxID=1796652 RepID=UPI0024944EBE|nr:hypothetical protein [Turicimonas muris]